MWHRHEKIHRLGIVDRDFREELRRSRNETEARYLINALRLIRHYTDGARGGTLITIGAALAYQTPQGELLLPLPLDYLSWTPQMAEFLEMEVSAL